MKRPRVGVSEALEMATTDELLSALSSRSYYIVCYIIPHVEKDPPRLTVGGTLLPAELPQILACAARAKRAFGDYFGRQIGMNALRYVDFPLDEDE